MANTALSRDIRKAEIFGEVRPEVLLDFLDCRGGAKRGLRHERIKYQILEKVRVLQVEGRGIGGKVNSHDVQNPLADFGCGFRKTGGNSDSCTFHSVLSD